MNGRHRRPPPAGVARIGLAVTLGVVLLGVGSAADPATAAHLLSEEDRTATGSDAEPYPGTVRGYELESCTGRPAGDGSITLRIPRLGVTVPVREGVGRAILARVVGHVPGSDWPGEGTAVVLAGHNITHFRVLDRLRPADRIVLAGSCGTWVYQVAEQQVVPVGHPVYRGHVPSLALVTCWPLNARYTTPNRYIVTATLVEQTGPEPVPD
ncbi:MAG TPA: class D sortase [Actinophytocola sp.]|uniref:class D sortase n=1 Tax=Actinophytocola sp. TaxID=1872138 RepID=UPI002DBB94D1|nr:class D sortase [Actinophytocola sp.]HEU5475635.1 class D sortase [Actinophytocola sp.]